jgi:NTP pyrophosphatase (non-canonical NTP hydrolase)
MTIQEYQSKAQGTIQRYATRDNDHHMLGYLGLAGETGSVLTTLKKMLRDGEGFGSFKDKLKEELGDVLWYVAAIASTNGLSLEEIAAQNLLKVTDRFREENLLNLPRIDQSYEERFPDEFVINFIEEQGPLFPEVKLVWDNGPLGDPLTDNSMEPNEYRYHDVFHLGHIAFLGWSPVFRHLMKLKRRSDPFTLDTEDRGRAQVAEEAVTLIIYNYAKGNKMLKESDRIDTELLRTVQQLVVDLEVSHVTAYQWEATIIQSYKVFHELVENKGGKVLASPLRRKLEYLGKL